MAFYPELSQRTEEELLGDFDSQTRPAGVPDEEKDLWYQEVAVRLAEGGEHGLNVLLRRIPGADEPRLRAILLSVSFVPEELRRRRAAELCRILASFLHDPRPMILMEAVDGLRHLGCPGVADQVAPLLNHDSPYVVGSALRFFRKHDPERARPLLLAALGAPDPIVRQNAVDELDDLNCVEALPALRRLLDDPDADVREAARAAVTNLEDWGRGVQAGGT